MPANPIATYPQTSSGPTTLIQEVVVSGSTNNIQFSTIPGTFKHLKLVIYNITFANGDQACNLQFNGDGGSNYIDWSITQAATVLSATGPTTSTAIPLGHGGYAFGANTYPAQMDVDIFNYANPQNYPKMVTSKTISGIAGLALYGGQWGVQNSNPVTQINITTQNGFEAGTVMSLYGWN